MPAGHFDNQCFPYSQQRTCSWAGLSYVTGWPDDTPSNTSLCAVNSGGALVEGGPLSGRRPGAGCPLSPSRYAAIAIDVAAHSLAAGLQAAAGCSSGLGARWAP